MEGAFPSFAAGFAMSQRRFFVLGLYHSPIFVILLVSGLREWDLIRVVLCARGCSPPNPFGGSDETRQNLFTPHHILEWGAKTCLRTRYWLYELPSGSRPPNIRAGARRGAIGERGRLYESHCVHSNIKPSLKGKGDRASGGRVMQLVSTKLRKETLQPHFSTNRR